MLTASHRQADRSEAAELLLEELQNAHENLVAAIIELDALTREPLPSKARVGECRWRISRASLIRRNVARRVIDHLSAFATEAQAFELRRLQESDRAQLRSSSEHVSHWKIEAVMQDWPLYCDASAAIRWKMRAAIGAEKRVLYSMLRANVVQQR